MYASTVRNVSNLVICEVELVNIHELRSLVLNEVGFFK